MTTNQENPTNETKRLEYNQRIYDNYTTPLTGTFLNLPNRPVKVRCPSCGISESSQLENELKWWAIEVNRIAGCLFFAFCCCFCLEYQTLCKKSDLNHYCKNCGCYFGRVMKYKPIKRKATST